jgi:hypothetical protein
MMPAPAHARRAMTRLDLPISNAVRLENGANGRRFFIAVDSCVLPRFALLENSHRSGQTIGKFVMMLTINDIDAESSSQTR